MESMQICMKVKGVGIVIKEKSKDNISVSEILNILVPIVFKAAPIYCILYIVFGILHGSSWAFNTVATQKLFDSVTNMVNGRATLSYTILMALLLGLVFIICQVLNGISNFIFQNLLKKATGKVTSLVNIKTGKIDTILFENPETLDNINKANEGIQNSVVLIIIMITIFTTYMPYFIVMGIYLYKLRPILALSLLFIFIPILLTQFIRVKIFGELEDKSAPIRREYDYYENCIVSREYFKETRILGAFEYFKKLYLDSLKILNKEIWKAQKKAISLELLMKLITLVGYFGVLYLLVVSLIDGHISVGAFGAIFASIGTMFNLMEEMICVHISNITKGMGTVRNFISFLNLKEKEGKDVEIEGVPDIKLENVSFSYPLSNKLSLNNINLHIKSGETVAVVGENGSGKTTLVKVMIGLYLPTKGDVKIKDFNTKEISNKSLFKAVSAVFQNFQKYKMTLGENISISSPLKEDSSNKYKDIAMKKADLVMDKERFKDGYNTMLSREFNGIDLSGGQWQRVAIARGFYSNHNIIVLDEPTAAIDPVEETRVYEKFNEMSKGKTSIIVTHRLGSAKIADKIVVLDKGEIVECGTHEELIKNKGKYEEMFNSQKKWYVET